MTLLPLLFAMSLTQAPEVPSPPLTIARASVDVNRDGLLDELSLIWVEGRFSTEATECFGSGYQGAFTFRVAIANGPSVETSLRSLKSIATCFAVAPSPWPIVIADYNHDSRPDLSICSYGNSIGADCQFFTLLQTGEVRSLPLPAPGYLYATSVGGPSSSIFKPTRQGFSYTWHSSQSQQEVQVSCAWHRNTAFFTCQEVRRENR